MRHSVAPKPRHINPTEEGEQNRTWRRRGSCLINFVSARRRRHCYNVVQEMKILLRHAAVVASASLVAFLVAPSIARLGYSFNAFSENSSVEGVGNLAALSVGLVWLVFTLTLKRPRIQQWLILGFISPIFFVPLFYQLTAWFAGYSSHSYGLGYPLKIGLLVAGILSWIFVPLGLLIGLCSAGVTWLIEPKTLHPTAGNAPKQQVTDVVLSRDQRATAVALNGIPWPSSSQTLATVNSTGIQRVNHKWVALRIGEQSLEVLEDSAALDKWSDSLESKKQP